VDTITDVRRLVESVRVIATEDDHRRLIMDLAMPAGPTILSFMNSHGLNLCVASPEALEAFSASDVLLRDGVAMQHAMPALGMEAGENMNGTDFIPLLLTNLVPPRRVALYGSCIPTLSSARDRLRKDTRHHYIDIQHGFHELEHYAEWAKRTHPDVVVLAMGMPKQELVASRLKKSLNYPVLIINGGAIVDFWSGHVKRAPSWVRRAGLEWGYRLANEPRRLFSRYVLGARRFASAVVRMRRTLPTSSIPDRSNATTAVAQGR
jgi:exopolysaccharide biosynthesis WecB/TagA/CpsF family protein